ncbi:MAG: acyltransferase [Niastella sp.]|nr:acyltransferase [Niastella sp.]
MSALTNRTVWLDYLRTTLTMLVVAHHAALAYTTFASFNKSAYILSTHPVVDTHRSITLDIFGNFNDVFFMSLMFFISGIFVLPALQKKGTKAFLRDRFYRLFIPFMLAVSVLMLLAYYPAYYLAYGQHNIRHYIADFFTTEQWPVGPPWFIWVLFSFNLMLALIYPFTRSILQKAGQAFTKCKDKPARLFLLWFALTAVLYIPIALWVGAGTWTGFYPFDFQLSRIILYFGYFILGAIAGSTDLATGIFATGAAFTRNWRWWIFGSISAYILLTIISPQLTRLVTDKQLPALPAWLLYYSLYTASCTLSCLAFLATFKANVHTPKPAWQSLSSNAYGIYLVHYIFITWTQYALLPVSVHAIVKFTITFVVSLSLSWLTTSLLRENTLIKKYI